MPAALVDAFSDHAARFFFVAPVDLLTACTVSSSLAGRDRAADRTDVGP
jgi:hypothetical protein